MNTYAIHPIAECYPRVSEREFQQLVEHIKVNGLQNDIILFENQVLDGRHRQLACVEAGIEPRYSSPGIIDPYAYVVGANERRRELTLTQRTIVAERMATLKNGHRPARIRVGETEVTKEATKKHMAVLHKVGTTSIDEVRFARENGIPEVFDLLQQEKIKVYVAKEIAQLPKEEQSAALEKAVEKKASRNGSRKPSAPHPPQNKPIIARPPKLRKLTPEEIGIPPNATMEEKDKHQKRYGRVQTQPKVIFDLREAETLVGSYVMAMGNLISETHPEPEALLKYLDMLALWRPQPDKGEEYATNFAGKAKRFSTLISERLPIAVDQLTKLLSLWKTQA